MAQAKLLLKALRVRRILINLAKAKENRIREIVGLEPAQSFYEACCGGMSSAIRECLCRSFCPCCVDIPSFGECCCPEGSCGYRLCSHGEYPNEVMKCFLNFFIGLLVSMGLFLFLCIQMEANMEYALTVGIMSGFLLSIGMAFFKSVRCMVFLALPNFCSGKGRAVLMAYMMVLVMNYPVNNFSHNMEELSVAATCGASMAMNETRKVVETAAAPLLSVIRAVKKMLHAIKIFAGLIKKAFNALWKAIKEIMAIIKRVFKWLGNIVNLCNYRMGAPYRRCKKAFDDAFDKCVDIMWILAFLCYIVKAVSLICYIARITELLCLIVRFVKDVVMNLVGNKIKEKIVDIKEMFYFNVTMTYHFHHNMNQSQSYSEVKKAILKEIREKLSVFDVIQSILDNVMSLTILLVVFKAFTYRRGYVNKDSFDNMYLTRHLFEIEGKRQERGQDTIFPLRHMEIFKYMPTFTYWINRTELKRLVKGLLMWLFAAFHAAYYMACDYSLYWILDLIRRHLDIRTSSELPPHLQFHVSGKGPTSDMFKSMVGVAQPVADDALDVDTSVCLPNPRTPNLDAYRTIGILLALTFLLTITQAHVLRLRHVVGACYYPYRERVRAVWLYNHILTRRGGFMVFMRRQLRRKFKHEKGIEKISITSRLVAQFKCCKILFKLLGRKRKHCISCGLEGKTKDMENFVHCDNCKSPYCNECFISLGNVCTACMNPVDYGDSEDLSVETDSSEEEADKAIRVSNLQARKQKVLAKQKKKEPTEVLKGFQARFGVPEWQSPNAKYQSMKSMMNRAGSRCSSSSSSSEEEDENESSLVEESTSQYDTEYQYMSKASTPSQSEDDKPRRKRLRKRRIEKVTLDIFNRENDTTSRFWRIFPT